MAKRHPTKYPGVFYIDAVRADGKAEKTYYIRYKKNGKLVEEPVGKQYRDDMTPAKAAQIRTRRIEGDELPNTEKRLLGKGVGKSLDAIFEEYVNYKNHKPSTRQPERAKYIKYIRPSYGSKNPAEISQKDFDIILKRLRSEDKAAQTIKHVCGLFNRLLKYSAEQGYCPEQKIKLSLPKINNERTEDLTSDQIKRLLEAMETDPHPYAGRLMKMALFTGMRAGELYKLEWSDIDYERNFILIRDPKAGTDKKIPLNDSVKSLLETVPRLKNSPYVFPAEDGHQRKGITEQSRRIKKAAGLPDDFRPIHGLRHVFASTLASSGQVDMYTLQKLLTHSDPKTTQRYAHLRDDALKKAADLAGKLFGG